MNYLKKSFSFFITIFLIGSILLFSNCNNDDDGDENANSNFVGTWTVSSVEAELSINGKSLTQYLIDGGATADEAALVEEFFNSFLEDEMGEGEIQLKADNTYIADFGSDPDTGTWSYNASTGYLTIDPSDPNEDNSEIKVVSITSTTLIIEQSETMEEDVDDDGIDEEIDIRIEQTFTKS